MATKPEKAAKKRAPDNEVHEATEEPPSKRMRSSYTQLIKVIVGTGNESETFFAHEDIICDKSRFFKAACSKTWIENQEKTVRLPDQEVEIFRMYLECVYTGKFDYSLVSDAPITTDGNKNTTKEKQSRFSIAFLRMCKLWAAADFLNDTKTQNEIMDCTVDLFSATAHICLSFAAIDFIAHNTPLQGGVHRWMVQYLGVFLSPRAIEKLAECLPTASMVQLLKELVVCTPSRLRTDLPRPEQSVLYHVCE